MAIFTIAVLLAGTIGYATTIYTLPTAAADEPLDLACVADCADDFGIDVTDCADEFSKEGGDSENDVGALFKCLEQAQEKFEKCIEEECEDDDDDDDD